MEDRRLVKCPLCHGIAIQHLGLPPGVRSDYKNRCPNKALKGKAGCGNTHKYKRSLSWRFPQRSATRPCGYPLTNKWGWPMESAITHKDWFEAVRHDFDPEELRRKVFGA